VATTLAQLLSVRRQFTIFVLIGVLNTALYFMIYNVARIILTAHAANMLAVGIGMLTSYYGNRRYTYGGHGRLRVDRQFLQFCLVFLITLAASSAGLWAVFSIRAAPSRLVENLALAASSAAVLLLRFWLMHTWVFAQDELAPALVAEAVAQRLTPERRDTLLGSADSPMRGEVEGIESTSKQLLGHRHLWETKPALRAVYTDCYRKMAAACVAGRTLEIGGGSGNFRDYAHVDTMSVVSTDIQFAPWLDAMADAHFLPHPDASFDNIVMFDVVHHLAKPRLFLAEAARVLRPGGRIIWCEPAITPMSWGFYTFFHPEPVHLREDPLLDGSPEPGRDPFDSNQAFPALLVRKGAARLQSRIPNLRLVDNDWLSLFAYPLSGGFRPWSLIPVRWVAPVLRIESRVPLSVRRVLGFRLLTVLERCIP